ncbi:hypothetical protein BJ322DRAFT_1024973 [Thelephora terrestris]|uniref:Uncharacterized protein n=1 Tax=Thelephora terrestris TaxID=56493 RepID=A0A9P6L1W7_9AGAM|nr:hypothetical protein BJ322DRAFT_1024973 [Thelephora terrestris]
MTWFPSDAKGNPLPPFSPLDTIDQKGGLFPSIENDSPWTFEEVNATYPSTTGIWESVREVWRLSTFEELSTGDRTWTALMKAWMVRHFEVCREAEVQPYGPVVEYLRHVVQQNLISGEGLLSLGVKMPKTPKTGRPTLRAKLPYVLVPPTLVQHIPKRKEVTPNSPTTTTQGEETEAMDEEWKGSNVEVQETELGASRRGLESLQMFDDIVNNLELPRMMIQEWYTDFIGARLAEDSQRMRLDSQKDAWEDIGQKFQARLLGNSAMVVDSAPVTGLLKPRVLSPQVEESMVEDPEKIVEDPGTPVQSEALSSSESEDEFTMKKEGKKRAVPKEEKKAEEAEGE